MNKISFLKFLKINSYLLFIVCTSMLVPACIAFYNKNFKEFISFMIPIFVSFFLFILSYLFIENKKIDQLSNKTGLLIVSFTWISISLFGSLPFYISGAIPNFTDAFFETISGFTTTGASILTNIETISSSMLFWRSQTQWLGGMGIIVFAIAILPLIGVGGLKLFKAESPGPSVDKIRPRIAETAKVLWFIYIALTLIQILMLKLAGMSLFDSFTTSFSTLATGGFSPKNLSIAYYNSEKIEYIISFFMLVAGVNFMIHFKILSGNLKDVFKNTEFKTYILILLSTSLLISLNLYFNNINSLKDSFRYAIFQSISITTTSGFISNDYENWPYFSQTIIFLLMFVGACIGSTSGGIKVFRILTMFRIALNEIKYLLHPKGVFILKINKIPVSKSIVNSVAGFFFLYILLILITTLVVASSNLDLKTSLSTALTCLGNIGPGFGGIGPSKNFAMFPAYIKWFLSFIMLVGRLEIYTVLVIFTPIFWRK